VPNSPTVITERWYPGIGYSNSFATDWKRVWNVTVYLQLDGEIVDSNVVFVDWVAKNYFRMSSDANADAASGRQRLEATSGRQESAASGGRAKVTNQYLKLPMASPKRLSQSRRSEQETSGGTFLKVTVTICPSSQTRSLNWGKRTPKTSMEAPVADAEGISTWHS
jgi:hypothetical protein